MAGFVRCEIADGGYNRKDEHMEMAMVVKEGVGAATGGIEPVGMAIGRWYPMAFDTGDLPVEQQ